MGSLEIHIIATTNGKFPAAPPSHTKMPPTQQPLQRCYITLLAGGLFNYLTVLYQGMLTYDPFCSVWVNISGVRLSALAAEAPLDYIIIPR